MDFDIPGEAFDAIVGRQNRCNEHQPEKKFGTKGAKEFKHEVMQRIADFCAENSDRIACCLMTIQEGHLLAIFEQHDRKYDFELSDPITHLDLALSDAGWHLDCLQFPKTTEGNLVDFARFTAGEMQE